MLRVLLVLTLFPFAQTCFSQKITREEMLPLFSSLSAKKWDSVFMKANAIINAYPNDSSEYKWMTHYALVLSAAEQVSEHKMTYKKLRQVLWPLIGRKLLMPVHPATIDTNIIDNTTHLIDNDGVVYAETVTRLKPRGTVLCFENFRIGEYVNVEYYNGEQVRCGGILEKIELNPRQDDFWVLRLFMVKSWMVVHEH